MSHLHDPKTRRLIQPVDHRQTHALGIGALGPDVLDARLIHGPQGIEEPGVKHI